MIKTLALLLLFKKLDYIKSEFISYWFLKYISLYVILFDCLVFDDITNQIRFGYDVIQI